MKQLIFIALFLTTNIANAATIIRRFQRCNDGKVYFEYEYDDLNLRLTALRVVNNSSAPVTADIYAVGKSSFLSAANKTFVAGSSRTIAIPTTVTNRIPITIRPGGALDGIDGGFGCPGDQ